MGYVLGITRTPQWGDALGDPIEEDEWSDLVDEDDELEWDEDNGPFDALWTGPGDGTLLWFVDGVIKAKDPSELAICKMFQMAERLSAVVEGDEGELYNARGQRFYTPEQQAFIDQQRARPLPLSDRIMLKLNVIKRLLGRA